MTEVKSQMTECLMHYINTLPFLLLLFLLLTLYCKKTWITKQKKYMKGIHLSNELRKTAQKSLALGFGLTVLSDAGNLRYTEVCL